MRANSRACSRRHLCRRGPGPRLRPKSRISPHRFRPTRDRATPESSRDFSNHRSRSLGLGAKCWTVRRPLRRNRRVRRIPENSQDCSACPPSQVQDRRRRRLMRRFLPERQTCSRLRNRACLPRRRLPNRRSNKHLANIRGFSRRSRHLRLSRHQYRRSRPFSTCRLHPPCPSLRRHTVCPDSLRCLHRPRTDCPRNPWSQHRRHSR